MSRNQIAVKEEFQGAILEGVIRRGRNYVALKPIVEGMGLDWEKQLARAKSHPVIADELSPIRGVVAEDGRAREMFCIPEDLLPFWLALVNPNKVRKQIRDSVITYQRKAAKALADAFNRERNELGKWSKDRKALAAETRGLTDSLLFTRQEEGKETPSHVYSNEHRMINMLLFGVKKVDRDSLCASDLKLLQRTESRDQWLVARGYDYEQRKAMLARFIQEDRSRLSHKLPTHTSNCPKDNQEANYETFPQFPPQLN